jgi:hypothetical protein
MTPPGGRRLRSAFLGVRPGPRNTAGVIPPSGWPPMGFGYGHRRFRLVSEREVGHPVTACLRLFRG